MTNSLDNDGVALDEGLDAEDVAAAVKQRGSEQLTSGKVRSAYYNSYCYLRDLQEFALDIDDPELKDAIRATLGQLDRYHNVLNNKYPQWD